MKDKSMNEIRKPKSFGKYLQWLDHERKFVAKRERATLSPGEMLQKEVLEKFGYTQTDFAKKIGCTHAKINEILRGKRSITPRFALQIERVSGIGAEKWLRVQVYYEIEKLRRAAQ